MLRAVLRSAARYNLGVEGFSKTTSSVSCNPIASSLFYIRARSFRSSAAALARNYYEILGVPQTATASEVKKAFFAKAKELHPDVNPDPKAKDLFIQATEAYETLKDENKRRMYDRELRMTGGRHREDFQERQQQQQQYQYANPWEWQQARSQQSGWRYKNRDEGFEQWYTQHQQTFQDLEAFFRMLEEQVQQQQRGARSRGSSSSSYTWSTTTGPSGRTINLEDFEQLFGMIFPGAAQAFQQEMPQISRSHSKKLHAYLGTELTMTEEVTSLTLQPRSRALELTDSHGTKVGRVVRERAGVLSLQDSRGQILARGTVVEDQFSLLSVGVSLAISLEQTDKLLGQVSRIPTVFRRHFAAASNDGNLAHGIVTGQITSSWRWVDENERTIGEAKRPWYHVFPIKYTARLHPDLQLHPAFLLLPLAQDVFRSIEKPSLLRKIVASFWQLLDRFGMVEPKNR